MNMEELGLEVLQDALDRIAASLCHHQTLSRHASWCRMAKRAAPATPDFHEIPNATAPCFIMRLRQIFGIFSLEQKHSRRQTNASFIVICKTRKHICHEKAVIAASDLHKMAAARADQPHAGRRLAMNFLAFSSVTRYFGKAFSLFTATSTDFLMRSETTCKKQALMTWRREKETFEIQMQADLRSQCQAESYRY